MGFNEATSKFKKHVDFYIIHVIGTDFNDQLCGINYPE